jgi:hypothetical protein
MATTFKTLTANDIVNARTLLHEAIPLTGTILSGTYFDNNIKTFNHGMFEACYDYPYLSSSANHILDITHGYSNTSILSAAAPPTQQAKKINIYNEMAAVLVGHDVTGGIQLFDKDGDIAGGGAKMEEVFFINFSRLLSKDEVKKDSFRITLATGSMAGNKKGGPTTLGDYGAASSYLVNSPAGEYGLLYTASADTLSPVGHIYYQAGVAVVSASVFMGTTSKYHTTVTGATSHPQSHLGPGLASASYQNLATGSSIQVLADSIRDRIVDINFNNTIELNSTIYFCRANHNEFNYSSNPTYLSSSQLRVKNTTSDNPVAYITTVGLYSSDNELLAVAKLSEPIKKTPDTELTLRVRLDY